MHVDGFRFDLASTLARTLHDVDRLSAFFDIIQQDPVISQVEAHRRAVGRRRGRLPGRQLPAAVVGVERPLPRHRARLLARRGPDASASSRRGSPARPTCYEATGRRPSASINFVTAHDGFTLRDLVSYNEKHNEANGEDGQRRREPQPVVELRASRARPTTRRSTSCAPVSSATSSSTLLLSQGVPDAARRRRVRSHPGRQQQRVLPGQRDLVVRLGGRRRGAADVHERGSRHPPRSPGVPAAPLVPGSPDPRHRGRRHRVVQARRQTR